MRPANVRTTLSVRCVAAGVVLLLAGCAQIPTSGDVQQASGDKVNPQEQINLPPGPAPAATRQQIVSGFIDAMMAQPVSTDVASKFLAPEALDGWQPGKRTVVYDTFSATESGDEVSLSVRRVADLDARGAYTPASMLALSPQHVFELRLVEGQWRITNPPDSTYVNSSFFHRVYLPMSLYFFDLSQQVLVPEPVYLPGGGQLATALVRGLLAGPPATLASQVQTIAPSGSELDVSVPLRSNGVAEVRLSSGLESLSPTQADLLAAQIVATVRQVPGVKGVTITTGGVGLDIPGASDILDTSLGDRFDPSVQTSRGQIYALRAGRLVAVNETGVSAFTGIWGDQARGVGSFDVDPPLQRLAGLSDDDTAVLAGALIGESGDKPTVWLAGRTDLIGPIWDRTGQLWVVDRTASGSQVLVMTGQRTRRIDIGPLASQRIQAFALSPDGIRFAAIVAERRNRSDQASTVVIGQIERSEDGNQVSGIGHVRELSVRPVLMSVLDVSWYDTTTVALLGRDGEIPPQPYLVRIDGSEIVGGLTSGEPPLGPVGANNLATSGTPSDTLIISDTRGRLWYRGPDGSWTKTAERGRLYYATYPG